MKPQNTCGAKTAFFGRYLSKTAISAPQVFLLRQPRITAINGTLADNALPPQTPANASYDLANRLTNWKSQAIPYDLNGNMKTVPAAAASTGQAMTYLWDARNRLKEVKTNGATTATFLYDAFGRRQQKTLTATVGATTTTVNTLFTYDGHNPIQERNGALGTKPVTAYIRAGLGIDEFISRSEITPTAANRHFLTNHLGSVLALTDSAGTITKTYRYEPYGKQTTTGEVSTNAFQYTGREADQVNGVSTTGLYYYRARYYDPVMQRFVSEDPIGLRGGLNLFQYVASSPVGFVDPEGEAPIPVILLGCGLGAYGGWQIGETIRGCFDMGWPPSPDQIEKLAKQLGQAAGGAVGGAVLGGWPFGLGCTAIGLGLNMKLKGPPPGFVRHGGARR